MTSPPQRPKAIGEDLHATRDLSRIGLLLDIALPLITYYALHALGSSEWVALLAATAAAAIRFVVATVWSRQLSWFSGIMLVFFGVGLALGLLGGDPRLLLLKDSFSTGLLGALFLASLVTRGPFALAAAQTSRPSQAKALERLYQDVPAGRRAFRIITAGWGAGLLVESIVRVPMVYLLPIHLMVGLSTAMLVAAMAGLAGWTMVYVLRAAHRHPELGILLPGSARL